ncbi:DNA ligase D [Dawidia soli]|uniref:DNA ligase (ATP) n=1 Tax=Dawidia soli TaxID=2782352 RepID=A0AAP2DDT7_9BACT|nr:DNA ligase D [Dawidia soli]MBT1688900.1 DNA ligase D [Dawidia soli]
MTKKVQADKVEMPTGIKPMLCTLIRKPFNDPEYLYEVKWDGYRIIAYHDGKAVRLDSRGGLDYTRKYPPIVEALKMLKRKVIFDGEAVVLNKEGMPDFDALQKFNGHTSGVHYYVFDILWLDGKNVMGLPLIKRRGLLAKVIGKRSDVIRISESFDAGSELFNLAKERGLEGIVAKRRDSEYVPNQRGSAWFKIPTVQRQEFVIGGWVESDRRHFRTLLFGAYKKGRLEWVGHAGGGFKDKEMPVILERLKKLETKKRPFATAVEYDGIAHWVKPELVANIRFATMTKSGRIRKPAIFEGFREDKMPAQVVSEIAMESSVEQVADSNNAIEKRKLPTMPGSNWPEVEKEKIVEQEEFNIGDCSIMLYNVEREIWKGIPKATLIQYYNNVSKFILPHLKNRPQTLLLKPKGAFGKNLFINDMEGRQPGCGKIFQADRLHPKEGKRNVIDYIVCNNLGTLLYLINVGCVDLNPWTSTILHPDEPDYVVLDLDPSDGDFQKAVQTAREIKKFLDTKKLVAFAKTSGKSGIHIFIPCKGFQHADTRKLAELIYGQIHGRLPDLTTVQESKNHRGDKVFLDPHQNDYRHTMAVAYSVRPNKRPTVSTPLDWREIKATLDAEDFTMDTILLRIKKKGDLFKGVLDPNVANQNTRILKRLMIG